MEDNRKRSRNRDEKIKCALCDFWGHSLTSHIKRKHFLSRKKYKEKYGEVLSPSAKKNYSLSGKINGDWISNLEDKENNEKYLHFLEQCSKNISEAIKNNPEEIERRRKLLAELNKREDFRKKASETATKTSKRKDIIEQRTKQLKKWRENNPDEFYEKCTKQMIGVFFSLGEKLLLEEIKEIGFKRNQFIKSKKHFNKTSKTNRKQVDFLNRDKKIIIEFDGKHHFEEKNSDFELIKKKDKKLNEWVREKGFFLIRVSQSAILPKRPYKDSILREEYKEKIKELIKTPQFGKVIFLGKEYGENSII